MNHYLYLLLNLGSLAGPLFLSFDRRVAFYKNWKTLIPSILVVGTLFVSWDSWFTDMGIWGFSEEYTVGIKLGNLPIEEWLFFFSIPYSCLFLYEVMGSYFPVRPSRAWAKWLAIGVATLLIVTGIWFWDRWYPAITFPAAGGLLLFNVFVLKSDYLGRFWLGYAMSLVPFLLVNGVLTALPVVWYNNAENLGIRIVTIPIEDAAYLVVLLLLTINLFEFLRRRQASVSVHLHNQSNS